MEYTRKTNEKNESEKENIAGCSVSQQVRIIQKKGKKGKKKERKKDRKNKN